MSRALPAFTDYPDSVMRPVTVRSYDNNKYCEVVHADGQVESIKRGYVYADAVTKRRVPDVEWHILGGASRHSYKKRTRKTTYRLFTSQGHDAQPRDYENDEFDSKAAAVHRAALAASEYGEDVWVMGSVQAHNHSTFNYLQIVVTPYGHAYELRRRLHQKYLRGYGKRSS